MATVDPVAQARSQLVATVGSANARRDQLVDLAGIGARSQLVATVNPVAQARIQLVATVDPAAHARAQPVAPDGSAAARTRPGESKRAGCSLSGARWLRRGIAPRGSKASRARSSASRACRRRCRRRGCARGRRRRAAPQRAQ